MTDPCETTHIDGADGTRLAVRRHGGQVVGWRPGGGADRLWLSPLARCGPGQAIRGGVPVVFPQFSDRGPLPKHGFARDRAWECEVDGDAWVARLEDDADTRATWPHGFRLALRAAATAAECEITLAVENTGGTAFEFTAALHDYLAVGARQARVLGLQGLTGENNADGTSGPVSQPSLLALEARDLAVRDVTGTVRLEDPDLGDLELSMTGFDSCVVWNPGPEGAPDDVPPGGTSEFVCLEAAVLTPVGLSPGESWTGRQTLRLV